MQSNITLLQSGLITKQELLLGCSNDAFLIEISEKSLNLVIKAVYKPKSGEKPLWDFSHGTLYKREYAAFLISKELGWPAIPETVIREGPFGIGSVQLYIEHNPEVTYFDLIHDGFNGLNELALFDILVNNADRKAGHCVLDGDNKLWSIDHGLCFHSDFKVRTVMLDFWGTKIDGKLITSLESLAEELSKDSKLNHELHLLISEDEIYSLLSRTKSVISKMIIPVLNPYYNVPWPLI
tara:strand:- start:8 stop:721 length:714 start_codon:yes stop_codon:yes gene_type:complete